MDDKRCRVVASLVDVVGDPGHLLTQPDDDDDDDDDYDHYENYDDDYDTHDNARMKVLEETPVGPCSPKGCKSVQGRQQKTFFQYNDFVVFIMMRMAMRMRMKTIAMRMTMTLWW